MFAGNIPVDAIRAAARRDDVLEAMSAFHRRADERIAALPGTCWNSGTCCKFGAYGHRLYVTTLEAAWYLAARDRLEPHEADGPGKPPTLLPIIAPRPIVEDACPHAHDGACQARAVRPLGCRIFFCDPAAADWQGPLTEELLAELRSLHQSLEVPYVYADWMDVLAALG